MSRIQDDEVRYTNQVVPSTRYYVRSKSDYNLQFGIIPKDTTSREETIWIDTGKPGAIVHLLNSWEEDNGMIVIWISTWTTMIKLTHYS